MNFQDQTVVITGASRGIGRAIAQAFGSHGASLALVARSEEKLQELQQELTGQGCEKVEIYPLDVSDGGAVQQAIQKILDTFGKVHVLINNAGITRDNLFLRMKEEEWDSVFQVNVKGAYHWTKGLIRSMIRQKSGVILNISSVIGLVGNIGQANYAASKAALIGFTKALAREVGRWNIRVNAIAPGFVTTDMVANLSEDLQKEAEKNIPLGRFARAEEVASACLFLASPLASYITGTVLQVDGGLFA